MITPPTAPSPGKPVSAGFFSRLISWVKSGQLIEGVGYRLHRTPNGTSLVLNPSKGVAAPAARPRQFDLRARIEARGGDDSKEYRLVVEFWHETEDAVNLSGLPVPNTDNTYSPNPDLVLGWNSIYESEWSSGLAESKTFFLNVHIVANLDEDGQWTKFSGNDTGWWISETQTQHHHETVGNMAIFTHGYKLASVVAGGSAASVTQRFDGPLMFLDFVELGRSGGGGGGGSFDDNKSSKSGRYAIVSIEGGVVTMKNPYFSVGGKTYVGSETTATLLGGSTDVVAIRISASGGSPPADSLEVYDSVPSLQAAQKNINYYTIPLFMISTSFDEETEEETYDVVCDFRLGPDAAMGEFS